MLVLGVFIKFFYTICSISELLYLSQIANCQGFYLPFFITSINYQSYPSIQLVFETGVSLVLLYPSRCGVFRNTEFFGVKEIVQKESWRGSVIGLKVGQLDPQGHNTVLSLFQILCLKSSCVSCYYSRNLLHGYLNLGKKTLRMFQQQNRQAGMLKLGQKDPQHSFVYFQILFIMK